MNPAILIATIIFFAEHGYQEPKCKDIINTMINCCKKDAAKYDKRCSGFKDNM